MPTSKLPNIVEMPPKHCMEAWPSTIVMTMMRACRSPLCEVLTLNALQSKLLLTCPTPSCKHTSRNLQQRHLVQLTNTRLMGNSRIRLHHQSGRRRTHNGLQKEISIGKGCNFGEQNTQTFFVTLFIIPFQNCYSFLCLLLYSSDLMPIFILNYPFYNFVTYLSSC